MQSFFKLLVLLSAGVFILFLSVLLLITFLANKSLPDYNRTVSSPLVKDQISISRNEYAVPNIEGKTNEDTFFGLGYAHAQDRLWQMLLLRKTAQGKLSEYFGEKTIDVDIFMRTLDIYNNANESTFHLSPKTLAILVGYSNGVNQRLKDIREEGLGRGTPNLFLFSPKVAPWTPTDSVAILKLLALQNSDSAKKEIIRLSLLKNSISAESLRDFFPDIPDLTESTTFSNLQELTENSLRLPPIVEDSLNQKPKDRSHNMNLGEGTASNIWVSLPPRTASGSTIVGYNLHTSFDIPLIWMLAKLKLESTTVVGATIPGIPAIFVGRSNSLVWGIASSNLDNQDLIIQNINPANPEEYQTTSGYKKFRQRTVLINIKGQPGLTHTILSTKQGPILPKESYGIETVISKNQSMALRWTGFDSKDRSIEGLLSVMTAQDLSAAKNALQHLVVPSYNFLFAVPGSTLVVSAGKMPKRIERPADNFGVIPSLGWRQPMEWNGYLDFNKNPIIESPQSNILYNNNNRLIKNEYPNHFSYDWTGSQRNLRMKALFEARKIHSLESFKEIHSDIISASARTVLPLLAKNLWYTQSLDMTNNLLSLRKRALELLGEWNGEMSVHLPQPLIYNSWVSQFQRMVLQDELGSQIHWFQSVKPEFLERVLRNINGAARWCDIKQTQKKEICDEIALKSLDNALVTTANLIGSDIDQWRWGDYHKARFIDKILGQYPIISYIANLVYEVPGGDNTLSMARSLRSSRNMHDVRYGSTLRVIFDLSNPDLSFFSLPLGQSGHLLSKHYDDLYSLWKKNEYLKISLKDESLKLDQDYLMIIKKRN